MRPHPCHQGDPEAALRVAFRDGSGLLPDVQTSRSAHDDGMETNEINSGTATMDAPMSDETDHNETAPGESGSSTDDAAGWDPPPIPPPPAPRVSWLDVPIARDPDNRRVGGVVAGVSSAYGFDRRTTRIATAIGAVVIPGIFALYVASMIVLPRRQSEARTLRTILTERRRRPLLIVLGIAALATGFGSWAFFGGLGWGFALVAAGVILWLAPNFGSNFTKGVTPGASSSTDPSAIDGAPSSLVDAAPLAVRRRRRPIQAMALAVASVGALVVGIGNSANWWTVSTYAVVLGVLSTLIAGTIVGAIVNRSWFGIPMLFMLTAVTTGLVITHPNLNGGIGERTVRPTTIAEAQAHQQLAIGRLTIDLTQVPMSEQTINIDAEVGYGQLRVIVPAGADVTVISDINAGHVVINGEETSAGVRRDDTITVVTRADAESSTHPSVVIDASVGAGEVNVTQAG
jgi:phage shock protein PspC (stress-responsive transcriptional regulator)